MNDEIFEIIGVNADVFAIIVAYAFLFVQVMEPEEYELVRSVKNMNGADVPMQEVIKRTHTQLIAAVLRIVHLIGDADSLYNITRKFLEDEIEEEKYRKIVRTIFHGAVALKNHEPFDPGDCARTHV